MFKLYALLTLLSGTLLVGCGYEQANREAASAVALPSLTDTTRRATLPPMGPPAAVAPMPTDTAAGSVRLATNPVQQLTAETRPAPRVKRGATVLADVPDEKAADVELGSTEAAAGEPLANTAELTRFLQAGLPAVQSFRIRPGRDTLVTGAQGTQLLLPAHAWDLPDSTTVVQLTLQEFYTTTDMILAGLSTTAGPQLLETGGMLHLTATANGQPVKLRPGAFVHLRMPARKKKSGMQLFEGVAHGPAQTVDWQLPPPLVSSADAPLNQLWNVVRAKHPNQNQNQNQHRAHRRRRLRELNHASWPEYEGDDKQLLKDLAVLIDYSEATRAQLKRTRRITRAEKARLIDVSKQLGPRILRMVQVKFVLDTTGAVGMAQTQTDDATTDKQLNKDVLAAIAQLGGWLEPAVQWEYPGTRARRLVPVEAARQLSVYFPAEGPVIIKMGKWTNETLRIAKLKQEKNQQRIDSLFAANWRQIRAVAAAEMVRIRGQFTDTSKAKISEAGVYEEFSAQQLDWINCDRFTNASRRLSVGVNPGQSDAVVKLVFKAIRGVMNGAAYAPDKVLFSGVPYAEPATLVALRRENGITYLATREVKAEALLYGGLVYRPVTMAELRAELACLE